MSDAIHDRQKAQLDMQKNDAVLNAFSKLVSGKSGYKTVIEKKVEVVKCPKCMTVVDETEKFCHECGNRLK
ncbi:MAG: hypothetical protein Q7R52_05170 [archaeon]|nr:hypothetical protein [archaeon]